RVPSTESRLPFLLGLQNELVEGRDAGAGGRHARSSGHRIGIGRLEKWLPVPPRRHLRPLRGNREKAPLVCRRGLPPGEILPDTVPIGCENGVSGRDVHEQDEKVLLVGHAEDDPALTADVQESDRPFSVAIGGVAPQRRRDRILRPRVHDLRREVGSRGRIVAARDPPGGGARRSEHDEIEGRGRPTAAGGREVVSQNLSAGRSRDEREKGADQSGPRESRNHRGGKRAGSINIPCMSPHGARNYRMGKEGYGFSLDGANVEKLKSVPDFEGKEE